MSQQTATRAHRVPARPAAFAALVAAAVCLCLLAAPAARASFQQTGVFAGSATPLTKEQIEADEEIQLGGVGGMAVNYTGAGGVPAGTVYAMSFSGNIGLRVAMFVPTSGGGLRFAEAWEVTSPLVEEISESKGHEPYERCGPYLGLTGSGDAEHPCKSSPAGGAGRPVDVGVDQTTGNVYAYDGELFQPGDKGIVEYTADGSRAITRFADHAESGRTTAETPSKLHYSAVLTEIAVDASGAVYLYDYDHNTLYHRLMVFEPRAGSDYEEYEYAGEVLAGGSHTPYSSEPAFDDAGHLYTISGSGRGLIIEEYAPQTPAAYPGTHPAPLCSYEFSAGGISAIAVDPLSGEVFFNSERVQKKVYRLGPCDPATHKFTQIEPAPEAIEFAPERSEVWGLAFDPTRQLEASRPPGVLYAAAPGPEPGEGSGTGEPHQSSLGYIFAHSEEKPPLIEAQSFTHVNSTGALLHAQVNPEGFATHLAFQYETEAAYEANSPGERFAGAATAPPAGLELAASSAIQPVVAAVGDLSPGTAYRLRVLAVSHCAEGEPERICETSGAAIAFRTFPALSPGLPDGRVWELVSPPMKNGGQVFPIDPRAGGSGCVAEGSAGTCKPGGYAAEFPRLSTPGGDGIAYEGDPFAEGVGAASENQYVSRRDPVAGWQTSDISPTQMQVRNGGGYLAFSTDLTRALLQQINPALSTAPAGYTDIYAQPTAEPLSLTPLIDQAPPSRGPLGSSEELHLSYAGASTDLSRAFFAADDALTGATGVAPAAPQLSGRTCTGNPCDLYEWRDGSLALVDVLPGNTAAVPASFPSGAHAISADGRRAFFEDESGQVYVREDAQRTIEIDDPGRFLAASADGSVVLLSDGCLYDLASGSCADLTGGEGGFQALLGQSEDLSHVYFIDSGALTPDAEANTCRVAGEGTQGQREEAEGKAPPGLGCNLYAWDQGATRLVATLTVRDEEDWSARPGQPSQRTAEASPDGRYIAFLSLVSLTGYANVAATCEKQNTPGAAGICQEAFLYDSATGRLVCASCNPTGEAPLGRTWLPIYYNILAKGGPQPRYLFDSGRLYFDSQDSLSPFDTNEGVEDVYQWEPDGTGSCASQFAAGGCLDLISAGHGSSDSNFLAADEGGAEGGEARAAGSDVFFTARDRLTLKDTDEAIDLYDAREGGGIASETEAGRLECQGESCQPVSRPPNDPTPGSSSFEGAGNVKEGESKAPSCPKGKVHKHGRCVKKPKKQRHHRAAKHDRRTHR